MTVKKYMLENFTEVLHTTLNPEGPGVVRIHLIPPKIDDGKIDVSVVRDISRFRFIRLFPSYRKGKHLPKLANKGILDYNSVKKVLIASNGEEMTVSNDGEIFYTNQLQLDVVPRAVYFSVPEGLEGEK